MTTLNDALVGSWSLVRFEQKDLHGVTSYPMGDNATGALYYTPDGHVSVHIMKSNRAITIEQIMLHPINNYYDLGYLAYSGRYTVNEVTQSVTHHIEISLYPEWIGSSQVRAITLQANQLDLHFQQPVNGLLTQFRLLWQPD